jgi:hypothetical protein
MKPLSRLAPWMIGIGLLGSPAFAQDSKSCHHTAVDERGDHVMGFDHEKTSHHFRLTPSGGAIEVSANDPGDAPSRDAIRTHLAHIAAKFSEGDFEAPMLIHDRVAPGVPVLEKKKDRIRWAYEDTGAGGRIVVATDDPEGLSAIHDFLRFQIEDHRTGDSPDVTKEEATR